MNFCTKCGSKVESTKFCTNCGSPIGQGAPSTPTPPPKFDIGGAASSGQGKTQATKAPPRAPTCMECGKPVNSGLFLCGNCAARKSQPRSQPSAAQPAYYPPPVRRSHKAWTVSAVLVVIILGVGWFGVSSVLSRQASERAEQRATIQRQEQAQREANLQATREREQAENQRNQQAQEASQRAFADAQRRAQAQVDVQRRQNNQGRAGGQSSNRESYDYSFDSLVAQFRSAISGADMAFSSFNGVGADAYILPMGDIAKEMEQVAPYTSQPSRNQQIAERAMMTAVIYMNRMMRQQSGGAIR